MTEFRVASSTVITPPDRGPSALANRYSVRGSRRVHEVRNSLNRYENRVAFTRSDRLCPSLSHWASVNGLNVEPGGKPLPPPYAKSVL